MSESEIDRLPESPAPDEARPGDLLHLRSESIVGDTGGVLVHVVGEVDLATAPQLDDQLAAAAERVTSPGPLVVNLTGVAFLASVGLSVLVKHDELCREAGIALQVVSGNRAVARTLRMIGLTETLTVFDTLDTAVGSGR
jgi:anti-sigma B factor antagonist